jgi:cytochrome P450
VAPLSLEPLSQDFLRDPMPVLARAREAAPAFRHTGTAFPVVSVLRHPEVKAVYRDFKSFSSFIPEEARRYELADGVSLIGEDPPVHTHLRSAVNKVFTAHAIHRLEADVRAVCEKLFDEALESGEIDMVEDLAARFAVGMIARLVGVPEEDYGRVRDWTRRQSAINGASLWLSEGDPRWGQFEEVTRLANDEMQDYFSARVDERIAQPRGDILTRLVQSGLERQEAISFAKLLVMAGNETTTNLINNTVLLMIDHPDQDRVLRESPGLVPGALEEVLRFKSPIHYSVRTALRDLDLGGVEIRRDDAVATWVTSAHRDPRVFDDADRFDVRRAPRGILAFGFGLHACLGSPLARLEGRVFLETLLRRTVRVERASDEMPHLPTPIFNGVQQQRVRLHPA